MAAEPSVSLARFVELTGNDRAFLDTSLPGGRKENLKLIGVGSSENPRLPAIGGDHGYVMNWVRVPPTGGSRMHSHPTPEVFIPIDGRMTVYWIDNDGTEKSTTVGECDCVSVGGGVMRGFRNDTDAPILMLTIVSGHKAGGSLTWHPEDRPSS